MTTDARIDHLVVAANTLGEGVAWCEATLGVTPGAGGSHPLMGTHNRLLRIATVDHPRAYFEIIAIDPAAPAPGRTRWFDLDDEVLREQLRTHGPRLVHFVASVPDVAAAVTGWRTQGIDRGEVVAASRATPRGLLQWQITVRPDGQRLFSGCLPTLIEWGQTHPAASMPESGISLQSLSLMHPEHQALERACNGVGLRAVSVHAGAASLCATLLTPRGRVRLSSDIS